MAESAERSPEEMETQCITIREVLHPELGMVLDVRVANPEDDNIVRLLGMVEAAKIVLHRQYGGSEIYRLKD